MTEFIPTSAFKVTFNKAAAHFLGQGTFPNGANLKKIEYALTVNILGYTAAQDIELTPKTVHEDESVSITLTFGDFATRTLQTVSGKNKNPTAHLQNHLQNYFDKESWGFRRNHTIIVEHCPLPPTT